jgi:hypothetical protein
MENYNTYAANISKPITLDFLINQEIISHQQAAQIAFEQFQILNYQAEDLLYWRALEPKNATKSVTTKLNKLLSSAGLKKSGKFRLSDLVRDWIIFLFKCGRRRGRRHLQADSPRCRFGRKRFRR